MTHSRAKNLQIAVPPVSEDGEAEPYLLEVQVGFLLRQATQRHHAIFAREMVDDLTPRQWAALAKLHETGPCSQNLLGRRTAMDAATIKGVIDRLAARGLVDQRIDDNDSRRLTATLTPSGHAVVEQAIDAAHRITRETLAPLSLQERAMLAKLLAKIS